MRLRNGELDTLRPTPIQVVPNDPGTRLPPMSRLNFSDKFVIDHGVQIYGFGAVAESSEQALWYQFRAVCPDPQRPTTERSSAAKSTVASSSRGPASHGRVDSHQPTGGGADEEVVRLTQRMRTIGFDEQVATLAKRVRAVTDGDETGMALQHLKNHDEDLYDRVSAYMRQTTSQA